MSFPSTPICTQHPYQLNPVMFSPVPLATAASPTHRDSKSSYFHSPFIFLIACLEGIHFASNKMVHYPRLELSLSLYHIHTALHQCLHSSIHQISQTFISSQNWFSHSYGHHHHNEHKHSLGLKTIHMVEGKNSSA
jgi:hypothetical protein